MGAVNVRQPQLSLSECLADLAVDALIDEADLSPKPGLVDKRGSGPHADLHLGLMHASALSLWPCFKAMADAALEHGAVSLALREAIGQIGRDGEVEMLRVTAGVNTHRGAIWALGLLTAAAALDARTLGAGDVTLRAARLAMLNDCRAPANGDSHGARVCRLYGVRGAREEAQLGFPAVTQQALPQLQRSRESGAGEQNAQLDALLAIMATLTDTCVLYRAGMEGLNTMQSGARAVLQAGGSESLEGRRHLSELDNDMLRLRASPGGAADLLAASLFLDRLQPALQAQIGSA
jgi:triphosphoribosyl-dephospho-CoA synthase